MSQTASERRRFPVPLRWLHAGGDLSRPDSRRSRRPAPVDTLRPPKLKTPLPPVTPEGEGHVPADAGDHASRLRDRPRARQAQVGNLLLQFEKARDILPVPRFRFKIEGVIPACRANSTRRVGAKRILCQQREFVVRTDLPKPIGGGFGVVAELPFAFPQCLLGALAFRHVNLCSDDLGKLPGCGDTQVRGLIQGVSPFHRAVQFCTRSSSVFFRPMRAGPLRPTGPGRPGGCVGTRLRGIYGRALAQSASGSRTRSPARRCSWPRRRAPS